jgi:hypothetical protein
VAKIRKRKGQMLKGFRLFRTNALFLQRMLGLLKPLGALEKSVVNRENREVYPPVFIIGAPRTGSTLLFRLLIRKFHFAYLTNLQNLFYLCPALVAKLSALLGKPAKNQKATADIYGYIKGTFSPSEAGAIYRHWLHESDFSGDLLTGAEASLVRNSINYISRTANAPFLSKNLLNSMRMRNILKVNPGSFFIWMQRDPLYTAQSILKFRRAVLGNDRAWGGTIPENYETIKSLPPVEQVIWQVKGTNDYISKMIKEHGISNLVEIHYESLCREPVQHLHLIGKSYRESTGKSLIETDTGLPPLKLSKKQELADDEWHKLEKAYHRVYREMK